MRKQAVIRITLPAGALEPGEHEVVLVVEAAPGAHEKAEPLEPLADHLDRARLAHVRAALRAANGSRKAAAKALGIDVRTIFRILGATPKSPDRQIDQLRVVKPLSSNDLGPAQGEEDG
jgi:transcriptional regulator with PAS, ATPase and Fis domain